MIEDTKMRVALVTFGTTLVTAAVIANAFYQKKQFYPSVVYLTKSNPSIAVLYAQVFVLVFLLGKAMRKIFFGQLRAAEVEHLIEKFWYVITETCLAFTVFRDDFSSKFVALFTFLLFMKAFHWLIEDRVDYMERSPIITVLFHLRVCSLLTFLGTIDAVLIHHAFRTTIASGASVQMVFGFEYAILLTMVVAIVMKYILHSIDFLSEHPWENKNVYLLYAELITGFVKCSLYIAFVGVMVKIHTFPLFAVRPMYLTIRGFKKSLSDMILSRRAISYMNTRFSDATEEELRQLDNTCIICREQMIVGKKLPCNHIFHAHCLRSWFQRQQSCPTCRMDVLSPRAQQQPQQQPQPRMHAPAPGFMGMPPPGPFGVLPPMGQPPASPPSTSETTTSTGASTATTSPTFAFPPGMMPNPFMSGPSPFFLPPPPFMGMAFPPPAFPPAGVDLSSLSVDQLQNMEGQERENIEARINVLRNVHSLLDAAILQLNQYSQVINALNAMTSASASSTATSTATNIRMSETNLSTVTSTIMSTTVSSPTVEAPAPSSSQDTVENVSSVTSTIVSTTVSSSTVEAPAPSSSQDTVENISSVDSTDALIDQNDFTVASELETSPENELRRRRLEKFQNIGNENKEHGTQEN